MIQDSLTTASPISAAQSMTAAVTPSAVIVRTGNSIEESPPVLTDSACTIPFPKTLPLTSKSPLSGTDYWADGLVHIERSPLLHKLDSASRDTAVYTVQQPAGIIGDPVPYRFKNDHIVTALLLISFFLVVWVISHSKNFITRQVQDFFSNRFRPNLFAERTQKELRGQVFLIFQTCFTLGLLFFDFVREHQSQVFANVSPYWIIGLCVSLCFIHYLFKIGLYNFVNAVFFTRSEASRWNDTYLLSILALGLGIFPVGLLMIYADLSSRVLTILLFCTLALVKTLLFYKCYTIFFKQSFGVVHLFLYFCTLEIIPLLVLSRVLIIANSYLLTIH